MSKLTFEYSVLPGLKRSVPSPVVPVTLKYKENSFSTFALIDSGATTGGISTVIAEALGIEWDKLPAHQGLAVASNIRYHIAPIGFDIEGCSYEANINIVEGVSAYQCILGQSDLFQRAKVTFERYNKKLYLEFLDRN